MKRFLLIVMVLCMMLCFVACNDNTTDNTTTTPVTTTNGYDEQGNKAALAKIGFEEIMNYLNICAAYNVPVEVNADDTIGDIVALLRSEGSDIPVNNVNENTKFFDYAYENPNYGNGGGLYLPKENADWLAIYVD